MNEHWRRLAPGAAASRRACLIGFAAGCWALAAAAPPARALPGPAAGPSFHDHFAGPPWLDQAGRPLRPGALRGKVVLFNFIFTACSTVCPVQTHALGQMLRSMKPSLRSRIHLVSVSLDPLGDTPRTLAAFAKRHRADFDNWSFVTGRPDEVQRLAEALRLFRDGRGQAPLVDHATSLWLVDRHGVLRMRYAGNPIDVSRLERELGALVELGP